MPEVTGHDPRLAEPSHCIAQTAKTNAHQDLHVEVEAIERETAQLRRQAQAFQQELQSRLQDPHVGQRERVAAMLVGRLESENKLQSMKEGLMEICRGLHERLVRLEENNANEVCTLSSMIFTGLDHIAISDERFMHLAAPQPPQIAAATSRVSHSSSRTAQHVGMACRCPRAPER